MKSIKHIKTVILFLSVAIISIASCKKDKKEDTAPTGGAATLTATRYGFDGGTTGAFKSTAAGIVKVGTLVTISAIKDGGSKESISIVLGKVTATGDYNLDDTNNDGNGAIMTKDYTKPADGALNYSTSLPGSSSVAGGGKVTITSLTATEMKGTFYIIAHNNAGKDAYAEQGEFSGKIN